MTKYAYQKITYRPTTKFRSGGGQQYLYNDEDSVLAWWSLSIKPEEGSPPTTAPDMLEQKAGKLVLAYDSTSDRGVVEETSPSKYIVKNSTLFNKIDVGKVTLASGDLSFTDGTKDKPFSIAFWIKPITTTTSRTVLAKWNNSGVQEYIVEVLSTNKVKIKLANQGASGVNRIEFVSDLTVTDNNWSHVVITYDALPAQGHTKSIKMYINGVESDRDSGTTSAGYTSMIPTSLQLGIGRDASETTNGIHANLADVVFYNKQLSQSSVTALYNAKDGVWIRSRNFDRKGSKIEMPEGGSIDVFREGVSIRNGEDISTSIRMKIHSTLNFVKAHSGSAISVDSPFDDGDIPIAPPIPGATSRITVTAGAMKVGTKINIISTDLTQKTYIGVTEDHSTISNGDIIAEGMAFTAEDTIRSNDPRIGMIAFMVGSSAADAADMLEIAINHVNGHNRGSRNKKISIKNNGAGRLDLTQSKQGEAGNTTITVTGDFPGDSKRVAILNNGFTGGTNDVSSRFTGVLNSSRGKSGYTSLLLHEIEKRDFGILNRYQDGTPFNDNVFDSPQKILDDVRTTSGSPQDRHLRVYIGETPNELYRPTDVYQKEARIDVFDRRIDFETTIPDIRDAEKDFTKRSRRLTRSGSWTLPDRKRGFSGECNCIHLGDSRYNDTRESSIPFYEFYNEGDISEPLYVKKKVEYSLASSWYTSYRHENSNLRYNGSKGLIGYWRCNATGSDRSLTATTGLNGLALRRDGDLYPELDNTFSTYTQNLAIQDRSIYLGRTHGTTNFNGYRVNDDLDIYNAGNSSGHQPLSFCFWVRRKASSNYRYLMSKEGTTLDSISWILYTHGSYLYFVISGNGGTDSNFMRVQASNPLHDDDWKHIFVTYDGSGTRAGIKIYVNGASVSLTLQGSANISLVPAATGKPLIIGAGNYGPSGEIAPYGFSGWLADIAFFSRVPSESEISLIASLGTARGTGAHTDFFEIENSKEHLNGSKFTHQARGRIETVLSQSSGARVEETTPKANEAYGVYAQSTVNTFYGISGAEKLQGRTFTARYRVASADRPFSDTSKEDLVPDLINTSNDEDFITEVKTLYMTGTSVHDSGHTGYNLSTTGFQGDLGLHKRDSLIFIGLKRGQ